MGAAPVRRGVVVFALRESAGEAHVLLLERSHGEYLGQWCPVAGTPHENESDAAAALRELGEETGIVPTRFYATSFQERVEESGLPTLELAVFVAFAPAGRAVVLDREHTRCEWLDFAAARERLSLAAQRRMLERVRVGFVERPSDEALRIV